jgi:hypothetical protein
MFLLLLASALAETDELGGYDTTNDNGDMMKLLIIEADETAVITGVEFYVETGRDTGDVSLVLYERDGDEYVLVASVEASGLPDRGDGFAETGAVTWVMEAGGTYALGAFLEGDWGYAYSDRGSDDPWFGIVAGSLRVESDGVVDAFPDTGLEDYYYAMSVDSVAADVDGDGAVAVEWGGDDCDDNNAMVLSGASEVAYDGIDQDCDGADLTDLDGDGVDAEEAGGTDCDDVDPAVAPGLNDVCGDGIDQDCSGGDNICGGGEGVDASPGCGCEGSAAGPEPARRLTRARG